MENSSSVIQYMTWNRKRYLKTTHLQQKSVSLCTQFSWAPPLNLFTVIWERNVSFSLWFEDSAPKNYIYNDADFCICLLKMDNFAILVSSQIVTLELFPTQNLIWISVVWFYFHPMDRAQSCNFGFSPLIYSQTEPWRLFKCTHLS
jgi:hypothetical protein